MLEHLERVYPDRCPSPEMSDREIWMAAGAANVVRKLRVEHNNQTKNALE